MEYARPAREVKWTNRRCRFSHRAPLHRRRIVRLTSIAEWSIGSFRANSIPSFSIFRFRYGRPSHRFCHLASRHLRNIVYCASEQFRATASWPHRKQCTCWSARSPWKQEIGDCLSVLVAMRWESYLESSDAIDLMADHCRTMVRPWPTGVLVVDLNPTIGPCVVSFDQRSWFALEPPADGEYDFMR